MANTRDTLGDQATLDGLVSHTLETFEDDGVTSLRARAFYENSGLKRVKLPNLTFVSANSFDHSGLTKIEETDMPNVKTIGDNAFYSNGNLTEVAFSKASSILSGFIECRKLLKAVFRANSKISMQSNTFSNCYSLRHLVLDSPQKSDYKTFGKEISFMRGEGAVYVPSTMLATYKADANWGKLIIEDIANYPLEKFETITDSWAEIVANQNYATDYAIGDTKAIKIGSLWYTAEIIGIDKDVDANGNTIPLTWMLIDCLKDAHRMNATSTNANGWVATEMRSYLISDILPNIDIKDLIVPAAKTFYDYTTQSTLSCTDSVWIPSAREIGGASGVYENSGCTYDGRFSNISSRIKYKREDAPADYFLRSASPAQPIFRAITASGDSSVKDSNVANGIALSFCTN